MTKEQDIFENPAIKQWIREYEKYGLGDAVKGEIREILWQDPTISVALLAGALKKAVKQARALSERSGKPVSDYLVQSLKKHWAKNWYNRYKIVMFGKT